MGRQVLLLLISGLLSITVAGAENYSCRDDQGQLHFADSPARLPDECLGKTREINPGNLDHLNIVPAAPEPLGGDPEVEESIRAAERERQQRQQQIQGLIQRAERLAKSYQDNVSAKRKALRSWSYSSREEINKANQQIARVREEKQQILQEIESARMPQDDQQKILQTLDSIED